MTLRVFEAFAGIGTQRMALKNIGIDYEVVAISEIDQFAIKSYEAIHGVTNNLGDISNLKVEDIPEHDLFTISFPCQDISVAGNMKGLQKGTRSNLLYESKKVIENKRPKYLLLENVKNLVGKRFRQDFNKWLEWLETQGYKNYWKVLNAKDYNIPQNRERVFCISIRSDVDSTYNFPKPIPLNLTLKDFLEDNVEERFYLSQEYQERFLNSLKEDKYPMGKVYTVLGSTVGAGKGTNSRHWVYDTNGNIGSLLGSDYKQPKQILIRGCAMRGRYNTQGNIEQQIEIRADGVANAITTVNKDSMIANLGDDSYIRKMTPLEYWRLMGIKDEDTHKAIQAGVSNTQLYKQAGNAIVVPVLEGIFKQLFINT